MVFYNVRIALKSLRRNPMLTALLIAAIAIGICVSTSFTAVRHIFARDPNSKRSDALHYVRLDSWSRERAYLPEDPKSVPSQITYRDLRELMKSKIPVRQSGSFRAQLFVHPDPKVGRPYSPRVRMVFSDFFTMFDVPFQYGGGWDKRADAKPEPVVVINQATNEKLFGGVNSVGRSVRIEDREFKVVGVIGKWRPAVRYYDATSDWISPPEDIFLPFNFAPLMELRTAGNLDGWKQAGPTYQDFLNSETVWLQYWVELPTVSERQAFRDYVNAYVMNERKSGRFQRPLHTEVTPLLELMREFKVVPPQINALAAVSLLFLVVCSLNLAGLLLGKFLARGPEISVRRALGASRFQVFLQHIIECEVIGVIGGAIGMALSLGVLSYMSKVLPQNPPMALDGEMILAAIFLSLVAGLLAGLYPAWRICTLPPALQLKLQ